MDAIREWLNGPKNYDAGAKLYLMYGKDQALRRVFSEPATDFKKKKLAEELKALLVKKTEIVKHVAATKEVALERISVADRNWPENLNTTLAALKAKWKPLFAEMMSLMSRIYDVAKAGETDLQKEKEAGAMAHRICDLDDECDAIYAQRDYYLQHNKLPDDRGMMELVVDPMKIPMALANASRYVRDYKNKLRKNPGDVHAAEKLKQYEWAVQQYKIILKID